jgi:hypothetical protein
LQAGGDKLGNFSAFHHQAAIGAGRHAGKGVFDP